MVKWNSSDDDLKTGEELAMRTLNPRDGEPRAVPIGLVLASIGRELDRLGDDVERLQDNLSPALTTVLMEHPEIMVGLQELDRLAQTLRALSSLIQQIDAQQTELLFSHISDLVADLPLGDLASRLMQPK